jgi:hypothetical protein
VTTPGSGIEGEGPAELLLPRSLVVVAQTHVERGARMKTNLILPVKAERVAGGRRRGDAAACREGSYRKLAYANPDSWSLNE